MTALAHTVYVIQHCLLAGVWFDVLSVPAQAIAELDVAHALAVRTLVTHGVPGAFADRLSFPLTHRRHDIQH
jgi:hypothetical protein